LPVEVVEEVILLVEVLLVHLVVVAVEELVKVLKVLEVLELLVQEAVAEEERKTIPLETLAVQALSY